MPQNIRFEESICSVAEIRKCSVNEMFCQCSDALHGGVSAPRIDEGMQREGRREQAVQKKVKCRFVASGGVTYQAYSSSSTPATNKPHGLVTVLQTFHIVDIYIMLAISPPPCEESGTPAIAFGVPSMAHPSALLITKPAAHTPRCRSASRVRPPRPSAHRLCPCR